MSSRLRVLFFSEAVTLAQVVRLATLAGRLPPARYDVHFASASHPPMVFGALAVERHHVFSLPPSSVEAAVVSGRRPYDERTVHRYVEDELRLFDAVGPQVVIGDFRLSLSTSTALRGVPYAALANAYWSPYALRDGFPVPDHPIVRALGPRLAGLCFPLALPRVLEHVAAPFNAVRRRYGLGPVGDLLELLTFGDVTLYADPPSLIPMRALPPSHRFIGAVPWSPSAALPAFLDGVPADRPWVYVTLGSSGKADLLSVVLEALAGLDVAVIAATAGRGLPARVPSNAHVLPFVPGDRVAARAALVISNGGSSTGYQALAAGAPVLGLPWNLDQYLASAFIERTGAGRTIRAGSATAHAVRDLAREMLRDERYRRAARAHAVEFTRVDPHRELEAVLRDLERQGGCDHVA